VDRLVSAPETEVIANPDPAPALEVMGPLSAGRVNEPNPGSGQGLDAARDEQSTTGARPSQRSVASAQSTGRLEASDTDSRNSTSEHRGHEPGSEDAGVTISGAQLFVFMESETAWRAFEPDRPCEAGRYALRIRVEDGVISEVWPVANPPAPTRQVRASQLVLGLEVADVADGEYSAEVVVEPRRPTNY